MCMTNRIRHEFSTSLAAWAWLISLVLLVAACSSQENKYVPPPPPEVNVTRPIQKAVTEYLDLTGNLQAYEKVDLVARVEGFLKSIEFKDGDVVDKGQLLFVIEPQPYEARVQLAQANVEQQKATMDRAQQEYARQLRLIKQNATSQSEVEKWQSESDAAKAALNQAQANLKLAQINLGYTRITAPFKGRIGRRLEDPGNLVGSGSPTKLATLYRLDPIYAYFTLNERDLARLLAQTWQAGEPNRRDKPVPVFLSIEGEKGYPYEGYIDFASTEVDQTTGTLLLRGVFPNPVMNNVPALLPGMYAAVRIPVAVDKKALLIPEVALGINQGRHYVLVVNNENVVEQRTVQLGRQVDDLRVIEEGLKKEERVVVYGAQRARPGAKVTPVESSSEKQTEKKEDAS